MLVRFDRDELAAELFGNYRGSAGTGERVKDQIASVCARKDNCHRDAALGRGRQTEDRR